MKNFKNIAAMLLVGISSTITFTSCQDDRIEDSKENSAAAVTRGDKLGFRFIRRDKIDVLDYLTDKIRIRRRIQYDLHAVFFCQAYRFDYRFPARFKLQKKYIGFCDKILAFFYFIRGYGHIGAGDHDDPVFSRNVVDLDRRHTGA